jgi:type I site-specific restriction-modification system R (restriction) subunit
MHFPLRTPPSNCDLPLTENSIPADFLSWKHLLRIVHKNGRDYIYDGVRKKYLLLQPEEFVRQLVVIWLMHDQKVNRNRIQVEKELIIHGLKRRFDIIVYDRNIQPLALIECKAPDVIINQAVFDQIAVYNKVLHAPFLMVTNGVLTFLASVQHETMSYSFHESWPSWE